MVGESDEIEVGDSVPNTAGDGGNPNNDPHEIIRAVLEKNMDREKDQVLRMEAIFFQLVNYYFVFQGVILSAISSSSSSIKCKYFWLPFSLSLIGAIFNLATLFAIAEKYKESLEEVDRRTLILYKHLIQKTIPDSETRQEEEKKRKEQLGKKKARRKRMLILSKVLFFIFAVLNLVATRIIPCRKLF